MTVKNGRDLLIKMDVAGVGIFEAVAGMRASRIGFNAEAVDVTNLDSAGQWRELLSGAGIRSAVISGSGVFRNAATDRHIREHFFAGKNGKYQVLIPDFGIVEGVFMISSLEYSGTYNGEATYEITLSSAGELTFLKQ